jgi:YfiH family protein
MNGCARSVPISSASTTDEVREPGPLPLWSVPGWRERFGVVAGITSRGDDGTPFDLGLWTSQPVDAAMGRWRTLRTHFVEFPAHVMAHQVHGNTVLWHEHVDGWVIHDGADGHATAAEGVLLLITVADCVPVYLVAPAHGVIGLLHAGWRGVASGILERGVALMAARSGATPAELVMHTGVAIAGNHYEVGAEVMAAVGKPRTGAGPWHLDLRDLLGEQARALGIAEVSQSGHSSAELGAPFFSHRRSGGKDGRMVAYLGLPSRGG